MDLKNIEKENIIEYKSKHFKPELLSPAGDKESFFAAIKAGASAIYMGLQNFNARDMVLNFTKEEYIYCINYAHLFNVKVYLTLNVIVFDEEIVEVLNIVKELFDVGLDAVIVQDIGLFNLINQNIPNAIVHASTQMSVYSLEQVKVLEKLGFKRVVLARELSIEEIEYIRKNTNIELEVFVHGALCVSYSGQCLLSYMIGKRSANKGKCAGTCRMKYTLLNRNNDIVLKDKYLLSKKDIYGIEHIEKLMSICVDSFKIEGRVKTKEYVYMVTKRYKEKMEGLEFSEDVKKELMQLFNRDGVSQGYLDGVKYRQSISINSPKNTGLELGKILDVRKEYVKVLLKEDISMHDGIEIIDNNNIISNIVTCIKDEKFKDINSTVSRGNTVWIGDFKGYITSDMKIYKTSSSILNNKIKKVIEDKIKNKKINISLDITIAENKNTEILVKFLDENCYIKDFLNGSDFLKIEGLEIADTAIKNVLNEDLVYSNFYEKKHELFDVNNIIVKIVGQAFLSMSSLNKIRNSMYEIILDTFSKKSVLENKKEKITNQNIKDDFESVKLFKFDSKLENKNAISGDNVESIVHIIDLDKEKAKKIEEYMDFSMDKFNLYINIDDYIRCEKEIKDKILEINLKHDSKVKVYLVIPNVVGSSLDKKIRDNIYTYVKNGVEGIVIQNIGYIEMALEIKSKQSITLIADYSLNISNKYTAQMYKSLGFDRVTPSLECSKEQISSISSIIEVEQVEGYINVLTSRYCILGSFVANANKYRECPFVCTKDKYVLKDSFGLLYKIVCDNFDCIMRLYRFKARDNINFQNNTSKYTRKVKI